MAEHTKPTSGPWSSDGWSSSANSARIMDRRGLVIAAAYYLGGTGKAEANARLIAAAPDMLEALSQARLAVEGLAKIADPNGDPSGVMRGPTIRAIDAALFKARSLDTEG